MSFNILMLHDVQYVNIKFIYDHVSALETYSKHRISYAAATYHFNCDFDLSYFDVVVVHFALRMCYPGYLSPQFYKALQDYQGFKVLHIQDEYDLTETTRQAIEDIHFDLVYSCVPTPYLDKVYPQNRFPNTVFKNTLTGYVPINWQNFQNQIKPIKERSCVLGYRGRILPFRYGHLAQEKWWIGKEMKAYCEIAGLAADIAYEENNRIYGSKWFDFILNCKAGLGTESGSNVFDDQGIIRNSIEAALKLNPNASYEEIHEKYIGDEDGKIVMNQIAPKIFEYMSLKTALVLFEGDYSKVILPDRHFIPLKKDFSNIPEVLEKLKDDHYLQTMVDRTYEDIILSERYTYQKFVEEFDAILEARVTPSHFYYQTQSSYDSLEENIQRQGKVFGL